MSASAPRQSVATLSTKHGSCAECGKPLQAIRQGKRFCGESCRYKAWNRKNPRLPLEPANRPAFRQLGALACSWCHGPSEGTYCSHTCLDAARKAPRTNRARRREEARQKMGLATADENNRESRETAQRLALRYLATHDVAIISDIRDFAHEEGVELDWSKPWTANVLRPPWFEATGVRRAAHHAGSNARKVNEYRLTAAGRAAVKNMGLIG